MRASPVVRDIASIGSAGIVAMRVVIRYISIADYHARE
jgi:hypothetical protein